MRRRGLLSGAAAAGAMLLSGCGPMSRESRVNRAAEKIDGVDSSQLSVGTGGTLGPQISGEVRCAVDEAELGAVFDEAWKAVVTLLHDADDGARKVQGVRAISDDGAIIGPETWLPKGHSGYVAIFDFYERYGLE